MRRTIRGAKVFVMGRRHVETRAHAHAHYLAVKALDFMSKCASQQNTGRTEPCPVLTECTRFCATANFVQNHVSVCYFTAGFKVEEWAIFPDTISLNVSEVVSSVCRLLLYFLSNSE